MLMRRETADAYMRLPIDRQKENENAPDTTRSTDIFFSPAGSNERPFEEVGFPAWRVDRHRRRERHATGCRPRMVLVLAGIEAEDHSAPQQRQLRIRRSA